MRKLFTALALAASVTLGGCITDGSFLDIGRAVTGIPTAVFTTTIPNPVGKQEMAEIEKFYQAGVGVAGVYVNLCRSRQIARLTCRPVVTRIQGYVGNAHAALVQVRAFVHNNDTINARSAIAALRSAVANFQNTSDYQTIAAATAPR